MTSIQMYDTIILKNMMDLEYRKERTDLKIPLCN